MLAAEAGLPVSEFVQRLLRGLLDADIEIPDGDHPFRMPPCAPFLTSAELDRLLRSELTTEWQACSM